MTPPEFLLASLGDVCGLLRPSSTLRRAALRRKGLTVRVSAEKAKAPARLASFRIEIGVPGLEDETAQGGGAAGGKVVPDSQYAAQRGDH